MGQLTKDCVLLRNDLADDKLDEFIKTDPRTRKILLRSAPLLLDIKYREEQAIGVMAGVLCI